MVSRNIGTEIKPGFEAEVAAAIGFAIGKGGQPATDDEVADWINGHIDAAVLKYREFIRPDISRERPTVAKAPATPPGLGN